jgi:preprotein translocase subunit SecE
MAIRDRERTENPKKSAGQVKQPTRDTKQERQADAKRKPTPRRDAPRKSSKSSNVILRYFQETGDEMRKVTWPSREEAINLTLIVLGSTVATTIFFGLLDYIFQRLAALLL